jgi:hypothetical protein
MTVTSTARVATDRGERYSKQLASHFGRYLERFGEKDGLAVTWR